MKPFDDADILREFVGEVAATLASLDDMLVDLEGRPDDRAKARSVYRGFHNLRGTCGWMALGKMESLALSAQELSERIQSRELVFWPEALRVLFATVDELRLMLRYVEKHRRETDQDLAPLLGRLDEQTAVADARRSPDDAPAADSPAGYGAGAVHLDPGDSFHADPEATPGEATPGEARDAPWPASYARDGQDERALPAARDAGFWMGVDEHSSPELSIPGVSSSPPAHHGLSRNVRVDVELLDHLMNQVGELVLVRNQFVQFSGRDMGRELMHLGQRLNAVTVELQESVMKTRMQPMGIVWRRFPRLLRDLSKELGKRVRLDMEGMDTELDRNLLEAIQDPLMHLLRNAVDHGVETPAERARAGKPAEGRIRLHAFHESGMVNITVSDDGRGLDLGVLGDKAVAMGLASAERLADMPDSEVMGLIFQPGLSTAGAVTHISGRGVGMDVVRSDIEAIGGSVEILNRPGEGLTVRLRIPLTLAIIPALIVEVAGCRYALPQVDVSELVRLESRAALEYVYDAPVYRLRGALLSLVFLRDLFELPDAAPGEEVYIVVLEVGERRLGLVVDEILDTEEIVIKPLGSELRGLSCYAGATILGDGRVALILDADGLVERARVTASTGRAARAQSAAGHVVDERPHQRLLLFQVGRTRLAMAMADVTRLEEFARDAVERVGEHDFLQYRDAILPLVYVDSILHERRKRPRSSDAPDPEDGSEAMQVIVHEVGETRVGLVVDAILDIVDTSMEIRMGATREGVASTAVIEGRITELLDLERARRVAVNMAGGRA